MAEKKSLEQFVAGLGMVLESVPLDQIDFDPGNPNEVSADLYESMKAEIRDFGFWQPVLVAPQAEDEIELPCGHYVRTEGEWSDLARQLRSAPTPPASSTARDGLADHSAKDSTALPSPKAATGDSRSASGFASNGSVERSIEVSLGSGGTTTISGSSPGTMTPPSSSGPVCPTCESSPSGDERSWSIWTTTSRLGDAGGRKKTTGSGVTVTFVTGTLQPDSGDQSTQSDGGARCSLRRRNSRYSMIDGEHRARIVAELGGVAIPAIVTGEMDEEERKLLLVSMNNHKGEFLPLPLADYLSNIDRSEAYIRQRVGMDEKALRATLDLVKFTDDPGEVLRAEIERERVEAPNVLRFVVSTRDGEVIDRVVTAAAGGKLDRGQALTKVCKDWEKTAKQKGTA